MIYNEQGTEYYEAAQQMMKVKMLPHCCFYHLLLRRFQAVLDAFDDGDTIGTFDGAGC